MRKFNTAGPIRPALDYHIPPLDRLDLPEVLELIRDERYFVLHAPRQTGKTSTLLALRGLLNSGKAGKYRCAYINVEPAQTAREDVGRAMGAIASRIAREARYALDDPATADVADALDTTRRPDDALGTLLETWARSADAPLVLLIDEIDAMVGDSLVSVLRQLRAGYAERPDGFPQSVVLCGVRDVRDYRIRASSEKEAVAAPSTSRPGRFGWGISVETARPAHRRDRPGVRTRGCAGLVGADPGAALARQRAGAGDVLLFGDAEGARRTIGRARRLRGAPLILRRETHLDQLPTSCASRACASSRCAEGTPSSEYVRDWWLLRFAEVVPRDSPAELRALDPAGPVHRGRPAAGAAGVCAPGGERDRPNRAEVRAGEPPRGPAGRLAEGTGTGGPGPAGRADHGLGGLMADRGQRPA